MTEALVAVQARISQIQSRFSSHGPARAGGSGTDFAAALANARLLQSSVDGSGSLDAAGRSGLGGLAGLDLAGLLGMAGATSPGVGRAVEGAGPARPSESAVLAAGEQYLGVPYRWGGTDPDTGLDCSGFVQRVYRDVGVELPRVSRDQARVGRPVASIDEARPGDLLAFGSPVDHIGIYAGGGRMLVAPHSGDVVKYEAVGRTPTAIRRVLASPSAASAASWGAARVPVPAGGERFAAAFAAAEATHGLPTGLLRAVAAAESGFDPDAASPAGARGLMQLMPATARALGVDPLDPAQAIDGAARLLAGQLERFGTVELALAAYNAGGPAVARAGGVPPFAETQAYVARVQAMLPGSAA